MEKEVSATSDFLDVVYLQTLLVAMNVSCLIDVLMGKALYEEALILLYRSLSLLPQRLYISIHIYS